MFFKMQNFPVHSSNNFLDQKMIKWYTQCLKRQFVHTKAFQLDYCLENNAKSIVKHLIFLRIFAVLCNKFAFVKSKSTIKENDRSRPHPLPPPPPLQKSGYSAAGYRLYGSITLNSSCLACFWPTLEFLLETSLGWSRARLIPSTAIPRIIIGSSPFVTGPGFESSSVSIRLSSLASSLGGIWR